VPISEKTIPNPYLDEPNRDITGPSGTRLTLMNHAYMTRQVHELAKEAYNVHGHITSLKPIRPENAPDPWEARALGAFEAGKEEVSSVEEIEGESYMRLMRPLMTTSWATFVEDSASQYLWRRYRLSSDHAFSACHWRMA